MAFFQAEREKAVLSLAEKPQLMKTYLELSTRVDESPLNTVWVAVKMPEAVDLKTYQEWKAIGCEVRRDAKGLNVIHASSNGRKEGPSKWRLVTVYDSSQVDSPTLEEAPKHLDKWMFCELLSKKNYWSDESNGLIIKLIPLGRTEGYLLEKYPEIQGRNLICQSVAYALCYKYLDENDYARWFKEPLPVEDLFGMTESEVNRVLKLIREAYSVLSAEIEEVS